MKSAKGKNFTIDIPKDINKDELINILKQIDINMSLRKEPDKYKVSFENIRRGKIIMYCSTNNNINDNQLHLMRQSEYIYNHFNTKEGKFLAKMFKLAYGHHLMNTRDDYDKQFAHFL